MCEVVKSQLPYSQQLRLHGLISSDLGLCVNWSWVSECKMDVKSTWIFYMASNGSCFMITWIIFKNHLLKVGPNTKPRRPWHSESRNCWFVTFNRVWEPAWIEFIEIAFSWGLGHKGLHKYTWGPVPTLHDFGKCQATAFGNFIWALTTSWSRLLARVWSGL